MPILIIFITIYLASRDNLMYANLTGVSTMPHYHIWIVLYTIFCSIFYAYTTHKIFRYLHHSKQWIHYVINITALIMICGALFPYTINGQDFSSLIHVYCSLLSSISFLIILGIIDHYLFFDFPQIYLQLHWFYWLSIEFLAILFIVFSRVNGYLEILFVIFVTIYSVLVQRQIKKAI